MLKPQASQSPRTEGSVKSLSAATLQCGEREGEASSRPLGLVHQCGPSNRSAIFISLSSGQRTRVALFPCPCSIILVESVEPGYFGIIETREVLQLTRALRAPLVTKVGDCPEPRAECDSAHRAFAACYVSAGDALHPMHHSLMLQKSFLARET